MFPGEVDAERFDWQMALLRKYCYPRQSPLRDGVACARQPSATRGGGDVRRRLRRQRNVALPILQRHGIPATFFIAAGFLNGGRMWNDSIIEAIRRANGDGIDLENAVSAWKGSVSGALADCWPSASSAVKHLPPDERQAKVDDLWHVSGRDCRTT